MTMYQEVVGPDLARGVHRCLADLHYVFITEIIPVLGPHLVFKGTEANTDRPIRLLIHHGHRHMHAHTRALWLRHTIPGFIFRSPLHIVIVILHLDEPVSQDCRSVIYVVICRHPVGGRKQPQVKHACALICSTTSCVRRWATAALAYRQKYGENLLSHHQHVTCDVIKSLRMILPWLWIFVKKYYSATQSARLQNRNSIVSGLVVHPFLAMR